MVKDYMTMLISTNFINFLTSEAMIYCFASDYLLDQSERIAQSVYFGNWYKMSIEIKKDMIFLMMRGKKPLHITAGKFFRVTRNTMLAILKTSYSFLSVLRLSLIKDKSKN